MQRPQSLVPWDNFMRVFDVPYWTIMWLAFALFSLFIFCMVPNAGGEMNEKLMQCNRPTKMLQALSSTAKAFSALDVSELMGSNTNRTISRRILALVLCICGMLNFYIYNAGLISSLMVKRYDLPVNTLDDILNNPEYKVLVWRGSGEEDFLRYHEQYHKIWKKSSTENGIISDEFEGERQIRQDNKKVFLAISPDFEISFDSYPCKVIDSMTSYGRHSVGYGFVQDSPYLDLFNYHIRRIKEQGWETEWYNAKEQRVDCGLTEFRPFSPKDVISLYFIFGLGCLSAIMYSVVERIYTMWLSRSNSYLTERSQMCLRKFSLLKRCHYSNINKICQIEQEYAKHIRITYHEDIQQVETLLGEVSERLDEVMTLLSDKQ